MQTLPVIEQLVEVMEERYQLFESAQVMDIEEYNEQATHADRLNRRVIVQPRAWRDTRSGAIALGEVSLPASCAPARQPTASVISKWQ